MALRQPPALTAVGRDVAVLHRPAGVGPAPVARQTAGGAGSTVSGAAFLLGQCFEFLDLLIEPEDDLLLDLLGLRATAGQFEPITFCRGYLRGLSFVDEYAVVGLSKSRKNRTFSGLALDENLAARDAEARCGLYVIDLRTGDTVHWLRIEGVVSELYDIVVLPDVIRPMAVGFKTDEIRRTLTVGDESCFLGKGEPP